MIVPRLTGGLHGSYAVVRLDIQRLDPEMPWSGRFEPNTISMPSYRMVGLNSPSGPGAITVDVIGHQWWWEFQYRDVSPQDFVTSPNELHIPLHFYQMEKY